MVYDGFGRQPKDYLPYAYPTGSGDALDYIDQQFDVLGSLEAYYLNRYPEDQISPLNINAYSEKHYEPSPLNRVLEQGAPGSDWAVDMEGDADHTIKFGYETNTVGEVELFRVMFPTLNTEQPQLSYEGFYGANELYKTVTKDENWQPNQAQVNLKDHITEEFNDKQGRVVLKRTFNGTISHSTYYIYDDFGNLTYVSSPKGSDIILAENDYMDFFQSIGYIEFVPKDKFGNPTTLGEGITAVDLNKQEGKLTVDLNMDFYSATALRVGPIAQLSEYVPNMVIGSITDSGASYLLSVQDGYLFLAGSGTLTSLSQSFTVGLPEQSVNSDVLDDLCYQYRYDRRNRLVEKKIPQKGWEYFVYDRLDRPVLSQDANIRTASDWLFTKYDAFDRVVYTGLFNPAYLVWPGSPENTHRKSLQSTIDGQSMFNEVRLSSPNTINGTGLYHSNSAYPQNDLTVYTINYYDSYTPDTSALFPDPTVVLGQAVSTDTKGLPTAGRVRTLDTNDWTTSVTYYDAKGRPIYTGSRNVYLNTTDIASTKLDFVGRAVQTVTSHLKDSNPTIVVTDDYVYDHMGRLLTQKQAIGSGPQELIVSNTYDELGQLKDKKVGNTEASPLQTVDYTYNIRGWLKGINDPDSIGSDLFTFGISYNTSSLGQANDKLYNGNISETVWRTANDTPTNTTRGYAYSYDALNRLTTANMSIDTGSGFALASGYHENGLQYDRNGNIMSLQRVGATATFDYLIYTYSGNQLMAVVDEVGNIHLDQGFVDGNTVGNDYTYDVNGNMVKDLNKGIGTPTTNGIAYNHLNLPVEVKFNNSNTQKINYIYDAMGTKLKKTVANGSTVTAIDYAGNHVYENGSLKFFNHPEGYVEPNGQGGYDYVYQYKDHLGNIRLSYKDPQGSYAELLSDTFDSGTGDWVASIGISNEAGRMKVLANGAYNGANVLLGDNFTPGDQISVRLTLDTGDTDMVRRYLYESDASGTTLAYYEVDYDAQEGAHVFDHTIVAGTKLFLKVDKSNLSTDVGVQRHFFVDDVFVHKGELEILEENNYYPFGLKHKGYNNTPLTNHPYKYNGKELNEELGLDWYDFGARNYMPDLGRWTTIDPLAEDFVNYTPYNSMMNNPVMFIDPDGRAAMAPIYGTDGNLLGTDDQGLQGKAIVMDEKDFKQGMSHDDALAKNKGAEGLNGKEAESKLLDSYNGLKDRPDYDGKITLGEANDWFSDGNGGPLYVDSSQIDLSPVETSDFGDKKSMYYNFFTDAKGDYTTGRVYGTIKLSLMDENGTVKLGGNNGHLDTYDFDIKENKSNNFKTGLRNFGTRVGRTLAGKGTAYKIFTYSTGTVEKSKKSN